MIRRPPRSTQSRSSAASDVYKRQGLIFKNNALFWSGLEIPCIIDPKNKVIAYGLNHKVKYCRIVRRKINGKNRFYLQIICEGTPYQNPKNKIGTEEIGLDVGCLLYTSP